MGDEFFAYFLSAQKVNKAVACKGAKGKVGEKLPKSEKLFILISNGEQRFTLCPPYEFCNN
ncbi:MAG: hypothetical protein EGQ14_04660 [Spirochaetia bacterium]|nr:hypothetical protein [Spirochaetia bacterium]